MRVHNCLSFYKHLCDAVTNLLDGCMSSSSLYVLQGLTFKIKFFLFGNMQTIHMSIQVRMQVVFPP